MSHTLAAVFDNRADADNARNALISAGIDADSVRVSASASPTMGTTPATGTSASTSATHDESIGDSIKHFFSNLFSDDDERVVYGEAVNRGNVVLTVQTATQDEVERAADIVEGFGPTDIDEYKSQWQAGGWKGADSMRSTSQMAAPQQGAGLQSGSVHSSGLQGGDRLQNDRLQSDGGALLQGSAQGLSDTGSLQRAGTESQVIPVMQEELKVGKRMVQRGGVRIYQRLVETPVQESVSLREEHVNVERRPVDRPIDPSQVGAFQETSFELRENAEEAVVQKTARVVEEVVVGKEVSQRTDQISDTVRSTQVDVEQLGSMDDDRIDDDYYRGHWNTNFANLGGTFDEYAPAYRYGASMRGSDSYRGRSWDESETTLRSNWESHNPTSAWDKFKAAVRHGWERMTS